MEEAQQGAQAECAEDAMEEAGAALGSRLRTMLAYAVPPASGTQLAHSDPTEAPPAPPPAEDPAPAPAPDESEVTLSETSAGCADRQAR